MRARMYSLDTSALLDGWRRYYPASEFPTLWQRIDDVIAEGRFLASKEVLRELEKQDDDLYGWVRARPNMFVEIDEPIQLQVQEILRKYRGLVDTLTGKSGADPFVIALAQTRNPRLAVVTGEKGGSPQRPKIPFVCQQEGVECLSFLEMIRKEGWKF